MSSQQDEFEIVTEFESRHQFMELLTLNPGFIVMKLGAEWCGPCKKIEDTVHSFFESCPKNNVVCCDIDVDESFDLYAFLKTKKMVNGIPAILVYEEGNTSYIPDYSYVGGDKTGAEMFFLDIKNKIDAKQIK
tara:strand:- start:245 stop:643 length:399 start_codon:yes stop_codon:yes gene_type:complete